MSGSLLRAIKLLLGLIIFIGLPSIGWGITDISGFYDNPARLGYAVLIILIQLVIVFRFPEVGKSNRDVKKEAPLQRMFLLALQIIPIALLLTAPFSDKRNILVFGELEILRYIGLFLFAAGFIGMTWAEISLGKQFNVKVAIQEDHKLITIGPFKYMRHPRYLGIIIFSIGISLIFRSGIALILTGLLTIVLLWRIHDEEKLLHEEFGKEWETYSQKTPRLIPYIY